MFLFLFHTVYEKAKSSFKKFLSKELMGKSRQAKKSLCGKEMSHSY